MKKKLLLTIASLGLLASCGANTSSVTESSPLDNSVATSSTTDSTNTSYGDASSTLDSTDNSSNENSSSGPAVSNLDITDVIDGLAEFRAKIVLEGGIYDLFGKDACEISTFDDKANDYVFSAGYVALPNDGVWGYKKDDTGAIELVECLFGGSTDNSFVDAELPVYQGVNVLASDTYAEKWEDDEDGFITDDEDTIAAVANIAGYGAYVEYGYAPEFITVTTTPTTATFEGEISYNNKTITLGFTLENIGTNTNTAVEAFIANPTIPTMTEFGEEIKFYMDYFIDQELPFCNKLTAYSTFYADDADDDQQYDTFVYEDYRSGNIIDDYAALMTGWTAGDKTVDPDTTAITQEFKKEVVAATDLTGAQGYYVEFIFLPVTYFQAYDAYYGSNMAALYPKGIFSINAGVYEDAVVLDTVAKVNLFLAQFEKQDKTAAIPALGDTFTPSTILLNDYTDFATSLLQEQYAAYCQIVGKFDTDADATAALKTWIAGLVAAGYAEANGATDPAADIFETAGTLKLFMEDPAFTEGVSITITLGEYDSTSKGYVKGSGAFEIALIIL